MCYKVDYMGDISKNKIYQEDCVEGMARFPDNFFDLAIADPPYNLSTGGNWKWDNSEKLKGMGGNWNKVMESWDNMPFADYFSFTLAWLSEIKRLVKPEGSFWVHGTYHNIGLINFCMQILGLEIINEVVWFKRNSFPNLSGRRLTASHETILWGHTGGSKKRRYLFNYDVAKGKIYPEDLLKQAGKQMRTIWDIPNNKRPEELQFGKHPTQKPERLIARMLDVSAPLSGTVLVPFAGSGTECVVAKQYHLDFVGFEIEKSYIAIAQKRIDHLDYQGELFS